MAIFRKSIAVAFWLGYAWCAYLITANSLPYFGETGRWQPFLLEKGNLAESSWYFLTLRFHVIGGIVCLAAILLQFSPALLKRIPGLHRWTGRLYGISIFLLVCLPGMPMAFFAKGGPAGQFGFLILGALTFWATWLGIQTARRRRFVAHREWMIRSFALVASAITFRLIQIGIYLVFPQVGESTSYVFSLYLSTFGNLAAAEFFILSSRKQKNKITMKTTTTSALTAAIIAVSALSPLVLSLADEEKIGPETLLILEQLARPEALPEKPPAPVVPDGTKMTGELKTTVALINKDLIDPMRAYSNRRVLMSRIRVEMDIEYHFAITDTSESLLPFDIYRRHRVGGWEKIADGVCVPGMESIKVAMPESGVMVDPIKHPLFAAALTEHKRSQEKS